MPKTPNKYRAVVVHPNGKSSMSSWFKYDLDLSTMMYECLVSMGCYEEVRMEFE